MRSALFSVSRFFIRAFWTHMAISKVDGLLARPRAFEYGSTDGPRDRQISPDEQSCRAIQPTRTRSGSTPSLCVSTLTRGRLVYGARRWNCRGRLSVGSVTHGMKWVPFTDWESFPDPESREAHRLSEWREEAGRIGQRVRELGVARVSELARDCPFVFCELHRPRRTQEKVG